jgi:xanthine dehydrogenase accessory factor
VALCQIVRTEGSTPGKPGWKMLVRVDGSTIGNLGGGAFEALVSLDASQKLAESTAESDLKRYYFTEKAVRGEPTGMVCGGMAEVFVEIMTAPPVMVICGAGPVGQALARAGELVDLDVLVVEDRAEFLQASGFPDSIQRRQVDRDYGSDFLDEVRNRELLIAIVTRCWETDSAALASVLRQSPPFVSYLGLMGSKRKIERVKEEVVAAGQTVDEQRLHAPIGLPIGGDSPGEIAVAIVAEMLQVRHEAASHERGAPEALLEGVS